MCIFKTQLVNKTVFSMTDKKKPWKFNLNSIWSRFFWFYTKIKLKKTYNFWIICINFSCVTVTKNITTWKTYIKKNRNMFQKLVSEIIINIFLAQDSFFLIVFVCVCVCEWNSLTNWCSFVWLRCVILNESVFFCMLLVAWLNVMLLFNGS